MDDIFIVLLALGVIWTLSLFTQLKKQKLQIPAGGPSEKERRSGIEKELPELEPQIHLKKPVREEVKKVPEEIKAIEKPAIVLKREKPIFTADKLKEGMILSVILGPPKALTQR